MTTRKTSGIGMSRLFVLEDKPTWATVDLDVDDAGVGCYHH